MDSGTLSYTIVMTTPTLTFSPTMTLEGYKRMQINYLSFESPLDKRLLVLSIGGLDQIKYYDSGSTVVPYSMSMPIKLNTLTSYASSDSYRNSVPVRGSIKNLHFNALYESATLGTQDSTFVTASNPIIVELEFFK